MEDEIVDLLSGVVTEERIAVFTEVLEQLARLNFDAHLDELIQVIALADDGCTPPILVERIDGVLRRAVDMVLSGCGIQILEADLVEHSPILEALLDWETYLFPRVLRDLLDQGLDATESFALVVEEITLVPSDVVLESIESVEDGAVERMRLTLDDLLLDEPPEEEPDRLTRIELIEYARKLDYTPLIYKLASSGYSFGTQFDVLVSAVVDQLDRFPIQRRGVELYLIKLFSKDSTDLVTLLQNYTDSTQERIAMNAAITGLIEHA